MLILSESDLRAVLTMRDVIDAVEEGFRALARGDATTPERLRLDVPTHNGVLLEMPAFASLDGAGALGTKIVSVFEQNAKRGLEIVQAVYLLLDSETGVPLSLMDGRLITAIRTAATSALATKFMAGFGSKRLAVFGAGVQARFHIEAMIEVAELEQVMIVSRTADKAVALAERVRSVHGLPCQVASSGKAVATANLICTCTSSPPKTSPCMMATWSLHPHQRRRRFHSFDSRARYRSSAQGASDNRRRVRGRPRGGRDADTDIRRGNRHRPCERHARRGCFR